MPVELATFSAQAGVDLASEGPSRDKFASALAEALKEPGCTRVYWSAQVEDPSKAWALFDWDTVEDFEKFGSSDHHGAWFQQFDGLLDFPTGVVKFADVKPFPPTKVLDGVVELLFVHFGADYPDSSRADFEGRMAEFVSKGLDACPEFRGISGGWATDNEFPIPVHTGAEGKGVAYVAFIGWTSVDAHMQFRETEAFKSTVPLLRDAEGLKKLAVVHVNCGTKGREE